MFMFTQAARSSIVNQLIKSPLLELLIIVYSVDAISYANR